MIHEIILVLLLMLVGGAIGALLMERKWVNNASEPRGMIVRGRKYKVVEVTEQ